MPNKVKKNTTYIGDDGCVVRIGRHCEIVDAITTDECVDRDEIEVKYDKDTDTIGVDGWFYSFTIAGDTLISIEIDNYDVFDDVTTIYESVADIWDAFVDNQPKEANA